MKIIGHEFESEPGEVYGVVWREKGEKKLFAYIINNKRNRFGTILCSLGVFVGPLWPTTQLGVTPSRH